MKCIIFYSWQSDLPNKTNRSFIEICIKKSIKDCLMKITSGLTLDYDRDTKGKTGSPDIAQTIIDKISKSDIFICDVSIINQEYKGRKCPNPNVLFELGYAVKLLGWNRIICLFNNSTGNIQELPFDINHQRILQYNPETKDVTKVLISHISDAIIKMYTDGQLYSPLKDYIKGKIDYFILNILKQIACIIYGCISMSDALSRVKDVVNLSSTQLRAEVSSEHTILGFFTHNTLDDCKTGLENLFTTITTSNIYPTEWALIILRLLDWLRQYRWLIEGRSKQPLFTNNLEPLIMFNVVNAHNENPTNPPDRYLLLKTIGQDQGCVLFSATLLRDDIKRLVSPQRINADSINELGRCMDTIIAISNEWLNLNGNEFILDPDYYVIHS
ncbi:MAG: hypothetical protein A2Y15_03790 [Clostridiales bacterium GWF2_36_10]|nr:MAG: hypothetical protein A2Y15_03790 [Clostridiales bacterium GWF2_36_10]HAN22095.1 hypothetical protein [Clostridiales bacterium]